MTTLVKELINYYEWKIKDEIEFCRHAVSQYFGSTNQEDIKFLNYLLEKSQRNIDYYHECIEKLEKRKS